MRLALGTAQFGMDYGITNTRGQVPRSEAGAMLRLAKSRGIDTLDTAIAYGESESCLGESGVDGFKIITKLSALPEECGDVGDWVQNQLSGSFSRLRVNSIYGLLLHRPMQLLEKHGKDLFLALQNLKNSGQVQKIGISIYSPDELESINVKFAVDLIQAPFNLLDRRLQTSGWLSRLKDAGVEIHTRSPFLQGVLLMSQSEQMQKFAPWAALWDQWHRWLTGNQISAIHACLAFPLGFPEIDRVVVGAVSVGQLKELVTAAGTPVTEELPDLHCTDEHLISPSQWTR